ncbi:hypothetical protein [Streptomyces sp. WMMB303]|nr:hypothetical protein [Streptomyces sp. WMMB303]MDF4254677.1 hypothetical protein [Streptomyces sp. WMMB303]
MSTGQNAAAGEDREAGAVTYSDGEVVCAEPGDPFTTARSGFVRLVQR